MSCITLIGGLIGCGKTSLINYIQNNQTSIFDCESTEKNSGTISCDNNRIICRIILDELCTIEEQATLMNSLKGWKCFRVDLLLAAEHFISTNFESKSVTHGPLTERSFLLLDKLNKINELHCKSDVIFLVEDNFYYRSMRYEWFQIARRANVGFCEIFLQCPLDLAVSRNFSRGYSIPTEKIKMMQNFMEYPEQEKFKWERYSIIIDSSDAYNEILCRKIIGLIEEAAKNPAEILISFEKIKAQAICSKNVVHQADNILRKLISKKVSLFKEKVGENGLKKLISELIEIRQKLLLLIRQGCVNIPQELLKNLESEGIKSVQAEFESVMTDVFEDAFNDKVYEFEALTNSNSSLGHTKLLLSMKDLSLISK